VITNTFFSHSLARSQENRMIWAHCSIASFKNLFLWRGLWFHRFSDYYLFYFARRFCFSFRHFSF